MILMTTAFEILLPFAALPIDIQRGAGEGGQSLKIQKNFLDFCPITNSICLATYSPIFLFIFSKLLVGGRRNTTVKFNKMENAFENCQQRQ